MKTLLSPKKRLPTILLAIAGIAIILAYRFCLGACSYLQGDILGIDLKYLGIFYMAVLAILAWLRKSLLCLLLLSFGAGGEIFLIGYQVHTGVYCPYCLTFGATVLAALAIHFDRNRKTLVTLAAAAGLLFFLLFFSGSTTPAYAAEPVMTRFGKGSVEVRVYTDYFCDPCREEEGEIMPLIRELTEKNIIRVVFVDTPMHPETSMYAAHFLGALQAKGDLEQAIAARAALYEASAKKIKEKSALVDFLKAKGIELQAFDATPVFKTLVEYIREDKIRATPTCVILGPQGKKTLVGKEEILQGLRGLLKS